jgi:acetylornithine deacetylase/succinyl-diaminopimelate desuccinylase-like protein
MGLGNRIAEWLSRLVKIPSVAPAQAGPRAGVPGEARLATELAGYFRELGGQVFSEEALPGRPNIYGLWRGSSSRWVAVDAHMDTVGVEQMTGDPFNGRIQGGRVYGRGAVDTKASLAVVLALLEVLQEAGHTPGPNLLIAATVDEEVGTRGAPVFAQWVRARQLVLDQLLVAEPTMCLPVYGHKGLSRLEFQVTGKSTHSSQPQLGRNAVVAAAHLVLALEEEHQRLQAVVPQTALGRGTLTVSIIHGGQGLNVVPDACSVSIDRRLVAGESPAEVSAALRDLAQRSCPLPLSATVLFEIPAFLQPLDTAWIRQLAEWSGQEPAIAPFATNAWAYAGLARECVVLGPGSVDQAHGDEEWVAISELEKLAGIYSNWWGIPSDIGS